LSSSRRGSWHGLQRKAAACEEGVIQRMESNGANKGNSFDEVIVQSEHGSPGGWLLESPGKI
jgi:hypothetical protein